LDHAKSWRVWGPRVALAATLVILALEGLRVRVAFTWSEFFYSLYAWRWVFSVGASLVIVAAWQWRQRRVRWLAATAFVYVLIVLLLGLYDQANLLGWIRDPFQSGRVSTLLTYYGTVPARTLIFLMVLFAFRLRGWGRRAQYVCGGCISLICIIEAAELNIGPGTLLSILPPVLNALGLIGIGATGIVVHHVLYKLIDLPVDRRPEGVSRVVALKCPRCAGDQEIPTGGGECRHCRLQIFIALDEGRCGECGYPLRGLTSERCPECGTKLPGLAENPNAELLAWARANDASQKDAAP
jgi:hypothetical protein